MMLNVLLMLPVELGHRQLVRLRPVSKAHDGQASGKGGGIMPDASKESTACH